MDDVMVKYVSKKPSLDKPTLIEGLPGIGNVGKLAVEHLVEEIKAKKLAEIHCVDFPPQVFINQDGTVRLVNNEVYYWKAKNKKQTDLILVTGDYQGLSSRGQYHLVDTILNIADEYGSKRIFTLGGYGLGHEVEDPEVLGAATDKDLVKKLKKCDVVFRKNEPGGGIVGASGLLLGLGKERGMKGACFMGETPGYLVDPKSAEAILNVLTKIIGVKIDFSALKEKAKEIEEIAHQLKNIEKMAKKKTSEDLKYIG